MIFLHRGLLESVSSDSKTQLQVSGNFKLKSRKYHFVGLKWQLVGPTFNTKVTYINNTF